MISINFQRSDRVSGPSSTRHRHGGEKASRSRKSRTGQQLARQRVTAPGNLVQMSVDAIFSAHSDGLMVILRRAAV